MFWKRQAPLLLVFLCGLFMAIQYFVPLKESQYVYQVALDWLQIIGIFAAPLGIFSMIYVQVQKVRRRNDGWGYAIINLVSLAVMLVLGVIPGSKALEGNSAFMLLFEHVYIPIQATMFSLLAFYIATAAYRAFRARTLVATIVLLSAVIVMLGRVPLGSSISFWSAWLPALSIPSIAGWIMNVPNMAAMRAIAMGLGLGAVATAMKIVLGIERAYMGRD